MFIDGQAPIYARRHCRSRPCCQLPATARLPSGAKNFFAQSLVNSRKLSCISRTCAPACQPLHPPPKALQRGPYSPGPRRDARGLRQPPVCPVRALPVNPLTQKFLTQSHTFSRHLSQSLVHLSCLSTPSTAPKMLLTSIPFETGTLPANQTTVSWPSRLPLRHTQYEIRNPAPNLLLPPCKSLVHRISCTHSRKPKAAADHLCTLTNVYGLTEQPQLQDHNAPAPDATFCAHPQTFFEREQGNT